MPVLLRSFRPQVLVTQHGCDTHALDPLADLELSVDGQRASYEALHALSHELCDGRWLACGGGGYALDAVVPRAWTRLLAVAAHHSLEPGTALPPQWRAEAPQRVRAVTGQKSVGDNDGDAPNSRRRGERALPALGRRRGRSRRSAGPRGRRHPA